ncbi:MAG: bifunctional diaminohydroxyphosphoribosylaminopyrimidine deaminase/5-amino-6-(5-phosphoribosylamino)uracil reductase RibD [Bacteroidales bacterium]|nr:bifunctional diaminohydroxyphosphoribosylaminopyrimidine deaminase/5-amino-6-(5-phosphoribosylamino)uracil reductase RibD [Bacteroidales bacterium]
MKAKNIDEIFMSRCLDIAKLGIALTAPNPMVGCVIVYDGKIIGEGYHRIYGEAHAEVNAINSVSNHELLKKSTLYVSLEPCSHFGKTPPCTDLIISKNIPRVVVGCVDSFSEVSGRGIKKLKQAGCDVTVGVLEKESRELNKRFFTFNEKKRPYIILKWAQSLDGFIDVVRNKDNKIEPTWITNEHSRILVHKWRSHEDAIMVGTNTAEKDNPSLNIRDWTGTNTIRIVVDRQLRLSENLNLFDKKNQTIVFTEKNIKSLKNIEYIKIDFSKNIIPQILDYLFQIKVQSVIIEGGEKLIMSFVNQNKWDEARVFVGNKFFKNGISAPKVNCDFCYEEDMFDSKLFVYRNIKN